MPDPANSCTDAHSRPAESTPAPRWPRRRPHLLARRRRLFPPRLMSIGKFWSRAICLSRTMSLFHARHSTAGSAITENRWLMLSSPSMMAALARSSDIAASNAALNAGWSPDDAASISVTRSATASRFRAGGGSGRSTPSSSSRACPAAHATASASRRKRPGADRRRQRLRGRRSTGIGPRT